MELTDQQLLDNWCTRRDAHAFQAIVQRHAGMVFHTALRILRNRADAEDTAQSCFEILVAAKEPGKIHALAPWLHGMVTNRAISLIRTETRRDAREHRYVDEAASIEEDTDWKEIYPIIDEAVQSLEENYRTPVIAHFLKGQSHAAIAEELGVTRSAITKRIHRGVEQLEAELKKKGIVPSTGLAAMMTSQFSNAAPVSAALISSLGKLALGQGEGVGLTGGGFGWLGKSAVALVVASIGIAAVVVWNQDPRETSIQTAPVENDQPLSPAEPTQIAANETTDTVSETPELRTNSSAPAAAAENSDTAVISGYVLDASRATVSGAEVIAKWFDGTSNAITDGDGKFEFPIPKNVFGSGDFILVRQVNYQQQTYDVPFRGNVHGDTLSGYLDSRLGRVPVTGRRVGTGDGALGTWSTSLTYQDEPANGELILERNEVGKVIGQWIDTAGPSALKHIEVPESIELSATYDSLNAFPAEFAFEPEGRVDITLNLIVGAAVSGQVVDTEGTPKENWDVVLHRKGTEWAERQSTDQNGGFQFAGIQAGDYRISAEHRPESIHIPGPDNMTLLAGDHKKGIRIVYEEGQTMVGLVSDQDGEPIPGVRVMAYAAIRSDGKTAPRKTVQTETNSQGRYEVAGLPNGIDVNVRLQLAHQEYMQANRAGVAIDGTSQDFTLIKNPKLQGRVVDAKTGQPITRFRIRNFAGGPSPSDQILRMVARRSLTASHDGTFSLSGVGFNTVCIAVSAPGYFSTKHFVTDIDPGARVEGIEIALEAAVPIDGRVVDSAGKPVNDTRIYLGYPLQVAGAMANSFGGSTGIAQTDDQGRFTITEYAKTQTVISAHKPGFAPAWTTIENGRITGDLILDSGATVEGIIYRDGVPMETRQANVDFMIDETPFAQIYVDGNGRFSMENVPHGQITMTAGFFQDGRTRSVSRTVNVQPGHNAEQRFDFQDEYESFIEGTFTVDGTTDSLAYLRATISTGNGDVQRYQVESGQDGAYRFGPLPAGTVEIVPIFILLPDGSYLRPDPETITTHPGETTTHDIRIATE